MSEFLLMYLTGTRLAIIICILVIMQVGLILVGSLSADPTSADKLLATRCLNPNSSNEWFYPRGKGSCLVTETNEVVFAFQLPPSISNNTELEFSRWQQYLLGILQLDVTEDMVLTVDARLAYRNTWDPDDAWKLHASSVEEIVLQQGSKNVPLFALGSLHHDYYLLNVRLPEYKISQVEHLWLLAIHQNGDFTKVWVSLKTALFSLIINLMINFWKRKHKLYRSTTLLEYTILFLGAALAFLNAPLEYLTLVLYVPFMSLLNDIRQGIFYAALLSFWLVFAGELLKIQGSTSSQSTLRSYWKHLSAVAIGCLSLINVDMYEHGIQLQNPFFSIETNLALTFNILAGISAGIYFFFLCYMTWKVFRNLSIKHTVLPSMSVAQLLLHKRFIYRLKFLMLVTLLCAAMTVTEFIVGRASEREGGLKMRHTSAFFMGVYVTWNIYACFVTLLCTPICLTVTSAG